MYFNTLEAQSLIRTFKLAETTWGEIKLLSSQVLEDGDLGKLEVWQGHIFQVKVSSDNNLNRIYIQELQIHRSEAQWRKISTMPYELFQRLIFDDLAPEFVWITTHATCMCREYILIRVEFLACRFVLFNLSLDF